MLLYHGTNAEYLNSILKSGLVPRGRKQGNWNEIPSHPDCVYLATYGAYFAVRFERWLILEIDTERLNRSDLLPDEDVIANVCLDPPKRMVTEQERIAYAECIARARSKLKKGVIKSPSGKSVDWGFSLKYLGTCCHDGAVPAKAITRYAMYDPASNAPITEEIKGIGVSPLYYEQLGHQFRALNRWIMGYDVSPEEIAFDLSELSELSEMAKLAEVGIDDLIEMGLRDLIRIRFPRFRFKFFREAIQNRSGLEITVLG